MYIWRLSFFAMILGILCCYLTDVGRILTQYLLCILCCLSTPLIFPQNSCRENSSTQTDDDDAVDEKAAQANSVGDENSDSPDGEPTNTSTSMVLEYPHVKKSLQQVIECAYTQLVLPWYCVPELREDQPLHQALSREFNFVIDQVIFRAKDLDVCEASVGCIRILTQHLHNAKQSDREPLFSSRGEEMAVLRTFSEALVRNLFPETLRGQDVNRCALNEIVALKALDLLVSWLSEPDNLNQLVLSQLDSVTSKGSVEELCGAGAEPLSESSQEEDEEEEEESTEAYAESAEVSTCKKRKPRKKANKLKEGWTKIVDKMKSKRAKKKKLKKVEQELMMRALASAESDGCSREGSVHSHLDSDDEDSDLEEYLTSVQEDMLEFKLSYEMWRVGRWALSIPHAEWQNEELVFTVHLEEQDNTENLHWDIKKTYMDVIYFRNRWQDSNKLPLILELSKSTEESDSDGIKSQVRASVEAFLQTVVADGVMGHSQPVFQFLCPLDKLLSEEEEGHSGVWRLLSGLAYLLTPGQEEDEAPSSHVHAIMSPECTETTTPPAESFEASNEKCFDLTDAAIPAIVISQNDPTSEPPVGEADKEPQAIVSLDSSTNESCSQNETEDLENPRTSFLKTIIKGLSRSRSQEALASIKPGHDDDQTDSEITSQRTQNGDSLMDSTDSLSWRSLGGKCLKRTKLKDHGTLSKGDEPHGQKNQTSWEQQEATKAIFDLLKEISGNSILMNVFDAILKPVMPILKKKVNSFLSKMNPTEEQMAAYIDNLREKQWPGGSPAPSRQPRTDEEKDETKDKAHQLICAKYSNYLILKRADMESVFRLFQDKDENKRLVYMLLSYLLREFLPDEDALNVSAMALQKVNNYGS